MATQNKLVTRTEEISSKVEQAEELLEIIGVEEPFWIKPYTDFDGPVRTRASGENKYHEGVEEAFATLVESEDILNPGIISGRGAGYLLAQVDELGVSQIDVAGEMGASYFLEQDIESHMPAAADPDFVVPREEESMDSIYEFNLNLFEHLAEDGRQLMYGDNRSNVTGSACIEAFGVNIDDERFSVEDTVYADIYEHSSAQEVQEHIEGYMDGDYMDLFDFHNDMIRFEKTVDAAEVLTDVFMANPFIPWGFHDEGDEIAIFPDYQADEDFTLDEFDDFVEEVTEDYNEDADEEFWSSTYHDYSFDFGKKGYENMKTRAAETILEQKHVDRPVVPTNTGDKPTDILRIDDSIFFAQQGTPAQEYCEENGIPYVEVEDAAESFEIQHELAKSYNSD